MIHRAHLVQQEEPKRELLKVRDDLKGPPKSKHQSRWKDPAFVCFRPELVRLRYYTNSQRPEIDISFFVLDLGHDHSVETYGK